MQVACYQRSGNEILRNEIIQRLRQREKERIESIEIFLAERNVAGSSTAKSAPAASRGPNKLGMGPGVYNLQGDWGANINPTTS
ncbi:hypothetical protein N7491_008366 [Penicillium cf. griseofulvum]|uniref:Uncharacterized protein n=1 Tax=Penicillium cf. griseofulvum TaxID=2972120 RepID=A0A9W9MGF5_9EURO|nr:hypothetical protein N7472_006033 [Penicillium cf. griseofulvum]KAJ5423150.1 hypothetical protein N7491_008366 [Penicillium cf. griseofulvum]KAJ5431584.1 hypothetical protein N7445_009316 [Penicillium cf. griseofulvum]